MNDPQMGSLYVCEKCGHVFDSNEARRSGRTANDGSRVCPECGTEFVRKFRESDREQVKK
jgi:DNA-directed RNA polymerase subunit RPC12/RpoP